MWFSYSVCTILFAVAVQAIALEEEFSQTEETLSKNFDHPEFSLDDLSRSELDHYSELVKEYAKDPTAIDISKYPLVSLAIEHYRPVFENEGIIDHSFQLQPKAADFADPTRVEIPADQTKAFGAAIKELFRGILKPQDLKSWIDNVLKTIGNYIGKSYAVSSMIDFAALSKTRVENVVNTIKAKWNNGPLSEADQRQKNVIQNIEDGIDLTKPIPAQPNNLIDANFKLFNSGKVSFSLQMFPKLKLMFKLQWTKLSEETPPAEELINQVFDRGQVGKQEPDFNGKTGAQILHFAEDVADYASRGELLNLEMPPRNPTDNALSPENANNNPQGLQMPEESVFGPTFTSDEIKQFKEEIAQLPYFVTQIKKMQFVGDASEPRAAFDSLNRMSSTQLLSKEFQSYIRSKSCPPQIKTTYDYIVETFFPYQTEIFAGTAEPDVYFPEVTQEPVTAISSEGSKAPAQSIIDKFPDFINNVKDYAADTYKSLRETIFNHFQTIKDFGKITIQKLEEIGNSVREATALGAATVKQSVQNVKDYFDQYIQKVRYAEWKSIPAGEVPLKLQSKLKASSITLIDGKLVSKQVANDFASQKDNSKELEGGITIIKTSLGNQKKIIAISSLKLGEGSFGKTFAAQDVQTGEWLAYKIIYKDKVDQFAMDRNMDPIYFSDLSREIGNLKKVGDLRSGEQEDGSGNHGFALAFKDGPTLTEELLAENAPEKILALIDKGRDAIANLHTKGLAHHDGHPGNIINGEMIDLGAAVPLKTKNDVWNDLLLYYNSIDRILSEKYSSHLVDVSLTVQYQIRILEANIARNN